MNKLFLTALSAVILMSTQPVYSSDGEGTEAPQTRVNAPPQITEFPDELIGTIFSHAGIEAVFNTLAVSKQWRRCAHKILEDYLRAHHLALNDDSQIVEGWQNSGTLITNFKIRYKETRAQSIYRNWTKKQEEDTPKFTLREINRLIRLPYNPPECLSEFNQKQHIELALDQYVSFPIYASFHLNSYLPCIQGLIEESRTLKTLRLQDSSLDVPFREILAALGTSPVTNIMFIYSNLSPEDIEFLCKDTPYAWREGVKKIEISQPPTKLLSAVFNDLLRALPNLENFQSLACVNLTDFPVVFPHMPKLTDLIFCLDGVNAQFLRAFATALKEGKLPAFKELIVQRSENLGDDALPDVLWIIENHPKIELNIFMSTGFSERGLRQVVDALAKKNYPWKIQMYPSPDYARAYNDQCRAR